MTQTSTTEAGHVPSYYSQIQAPGEHVRFRNFDDKDTYAEYAGYVESATSRNFVLDFGAKEAWAAFNIGHREMDALLRSKVGQPSLLLRKPTRLLDNPRLITFLQRPATLSTRWM